MHPPSHPAGFLPWIAAAATIAAAPLAGSDAAGASGARPPADSLFGPPIAVARDARSADEALPSRRPANWIDQSPEEARRKSAGCLECHRGIEDMHASTNVVLGCTDCHGGDPTPGLTLRKAHVAPTNPVFWQTS